MKLTKAQIEQIIDYEIVVDCYSEEEANMGWAIYMEENIYYPFEAEYQVKKKDGKRQWSKVMVVSNETNDSNFEGGNYYKSFTNENSSITFSAQEQRKEAAVRMKRMSIQGVQPKLSANLDTSYPSISSKPSPFRIRRPNCR